MSHVAKTFATSGGSLREVLSDVSLSVERGEFVSILGTMGCGKSTLLKILAGLIAPDAGQVTIDREVVRGVRPSAAIVFQNYSLLPWFSALENVRLAVGAAFPDWPRDRQRQQAVRHLESVGLGHAVRSRSSPSCCFSTSRLAHWTRSRATHCSRSSRGCARWRAVQSRP
jgi:ABC-type nitrate/sulfonate/bicarbonate transport system ATPase subunit